MDCIFCGILQGNIPSKKVYEDDHVYAFHDIHPVAPVHVLIIPKKHVSSIANVTEEDLPYINSIHLAISEIAKQLDVAESGFRIVSNVGKHGQQTVFHLHYHLIGGRQLTADMG